MTSSNQFAPFSETAENEEVCCGAGWVDQTRWGTARSQMGAAGAQRAPLGETGWLVGRRAFWPCLGAANGAHPAWIASSSPHVPFHRHQFDAHLVPRVILVRAPQPRNGAHDPIVRPGRLPYQIQRSA